MVCGLKAIQPENRLPQPRITCTSGFQAFTTAAMPPIKPPPPTGTMMASTPWGDSCCSSSTATVPWPAITCTPAEASSSRTSEEEPPTRVLLPHRLSADVAAWRCCC